MGVAVATEVETTFNGAPGESMCTNNAAVDWRGTFVAVIWLLRSTTHALVMGHARTHTHTPRAHTTCANHMHTSHARIHHTHTPHTGDEVFAGMILLDQAPRPPNFFDGMPSPVFRPAVARWRPGSVSPASKLRLRPPQKIRNQFIIDFIAMQSTRWRATSTTTSTNTSTSSGRGNNNRGTNGGGNGRSTVSAGREEEEQREWTWAFDPAKDQKMVFSHRFPKSITRNVSLAVFQQLRCRAAVVVGDESVIVAPPIRAYIRHALPDHIPVTVLRQCGHHVMVRSVVALACVATYERRNRTMALFAYMRMRLSCVCASMCVRATNKHTTLQVGCWFRFSFWFCSLNDCLCFFFFWSPAGPAVGTGCCSGLHSGFMGHACVACGRFTHCLLYTSPSPRDRG